MLLCNRGFAAHASSAQLHISRQPRRASCACSKALQQLEKPAAVSATVQQVLQEPPPRPAPAAGTAAAPSSTSSAGSEADAGGGSLLPADGVSPAMCTEQRRMLCANQQPASCCLLSCVIPLCTPHLVFQTLACCSCLCSCIPCVARHDPHACCADAAASLQPQTAISTAAKRKTAATKVKQRYELPKEPVKV